MGYGDTYCDGVRLTMDILKQNGFEAIINDDLVGSFLGLGAFVGALAAAGVGALAAHAEGADSEQLIVVLLVGGLLGLSVIGVVSSSVVSYVTSLWVCFAMDPTVLHETKLSQYQKLTDALAVRWGSHTDVPCYEYVNATCTGSSTQSPPEYAASVPMQETHGTK